jgi:predicted RNA-binding Zn-ribbon protein involved in translation (DUF1610 family)
VSASPGQTSSRAVDTPVSLAYSEYGKPPALVILPLVFLTPPERFVRSGKRLGLLWALGFLSLVLPVLHFCLPPLLLLGGVVGAALAYGATVRLEEAQAVTCPQCGTAITLASARYGWPLRFDCKACGASIRATPTAL